MKVRVLGAITSMLLVRLLLPSECVAALDASRVLGPEKCSACHKAEYNVWRATTHATMYTILHKKEAALSVAAAMGVRTIKTDSVCMNCHFTPVPMAGKTTSTAGVSCESCHGAARDWINVHNDLGGFTSETEPAEHKRNRLAAAARAGMVAPAGASLYDLIGKCYDCHTVPNEKLVNTGGHSTGGTFDLINRVNAIRHNFLDSRGAVNAEIPAAEKHRIFLMGTIQQLRASLRNATLATEDGRYSKDAGKRVKNAIDDLKMIQDQLQLPELQEMLLASKGLALRPGNGSEVQYALSKIAAAAIRALKYDERRLSALQPLLDGPAQEATSEETTQVAETVASSAAAPASDRSAIKRIRNLTSASAQPSAPLPMKRHVRPPSKHRTIGPASCSSSCHGGANAWWEKDKHYSSADRLLNEDPKAIKIARLYGLSEKDMKNGQNICSDCHATIVTGREAREAADGVGCEHCHGPAGDWIKLHNQNDKFNPGAFSSGMVQLADVKQRANVCTGCHYINEPRLISSGHPSNARFDYVQALGRIKHWKDPLSANETWKEAVAAAIASRGAVPGGGNLATRETKSFSAPEPVQGERVAAIQVQAPSVAVGIRPRPADLQPIESAPEEPAPATTSQATKPIVMTMAPLAPIRENASISEMLLLAKKRLETLYQQSGSHH